MASQAHLDKMQLRQNYRNLWHNDLVHTIQADTPFDWGRSVFATFRLLPCSLVWALCILLAPQAGTLQ
ncbi:unnamed protein product [Linum tenue]|uniref:Uncharacterized protein n=1 Tax=Linum tenue TaxID=586396 RepID=A0AAV0Q145_9ROSI|nr:unnamed protein product [Linum tenue]